MELKISIVTCSDTRDLAQDEAGAALEELIETQGWTVASHVVVRDDVSEIGDAIVEAADECHANVVLTCGGVTLRAAPPFYAATVRAVSWLLVKENYQARDIYHKHYSRESII